MSKNIGFPIRTILKTGHDSERVNLFLFAEGYNKGQEQSFFNNIKEHIDLAFKDHYREFSSLFNIYAVFSHNDDEKGKSFFDIAKGTYLGRDIYRMPNNGENKLKRIINIIENSFLDKGGKVGDISITNFELGRAAAYPLIDSKPYNKQFNVINRDDKNRVLDHETGHTLFNLGDEYTGGVNDENTGNISSNNQPNQIKWKEFVGFKDIGIVYLGNTADNRSIYKPSKSCLMNSLDSNARFCEVCKYNIFLRFNQFKTRDIYIAQPSHWSMIIMENTKN